MKERNPLLSDRKPTNREETIVRKLSFGDHHNCNWFQKSHQLDSKISKSLMRRDLSQIAY